MNAKLKIEEQRFDQAKQSLQKQYRMELDRNPNAIKKMNPNNYKSDVSKIAMQIELIKHNRRTNLKYQQILSSRSHFILYIYLSGIRPKIWRTIRVPSYLTLHTFYDKILCVLFGWTRNYATYMLQNSQLDYRGFTDIMRSDIVRVISF